MKLNTAKALLCLGAMFSGSAFAATAGEFADAQLVADTFVAVIASGDEQNQSATGSLLAVADRAGFVKNDFEITISANVALGVIDEDTRFGVISGSNKGRALYTGSSDGGSVTQCDDLIDKDTAGLAGSLVVAGSIDLDEPNGCGI